MSYPPRLTRGQLRKRWRWEMHRLRDPQTYEPFTTWLRKRRLKKRRRQMARESRRGNRR